jgi:hypothetical protein
MSTDPSTPTTGLWPWVVRRVGGVHLAWVRNLVEVWRIGR